MTALAHANPSRVVTHRLPRKAREHSRAPPRALFPTEQVGVEPKSPSADGRDVAAMCAITTGDSK